MGVWLALRRTLPRKLGSTPKIPLHSIAVVVHVTQSSRRFAVALLGGGAVKFGSPLNVFCDPFGVEVHVPEAELRFGVPLGRRLPPESPSTNMVNWQALSVVIKKAHMKLSLLEIVGKGYA